MTNDNNSLVHTTWNGKYHIVFALKYRRKREHKAEIGKILPGINILMTVHCR